MGQSVGGSDMSKHGKKCDMCWLMLCIQFDGYTDTLGDKQGRSS